MALVSMKGTPYSCGMTHSRVRSATNGVPRGSQGVIFEDKETKGVSKNLRRTDEKRESMPREKKPSVPRDIFGSDRSPGKTSLVHILRYLTYLGKFLSIFPFHHSVLS